MEVTTTENEIKLAKVPTDAMVHIVGSKSMETDLLVDFLDRELEYTCRFTPIDNLMTVLNHYLDRTHLAFLDFSSSNKSPVFKLPILKQAYRYPRCHPIVYNVDPAQCIEPNALKSGIRGILYAHEPPALFPRAARAVLNDELWYSREILLQFISEDAQKSALPGAAGAILTRREMEILTKLAEGLTNREIARHFNISSHTVKTHLYNIYKKTKVSSRLQATLWLANSS